MERSFETKDTAVEETQPGPEGKREKVSVGGREGGREGGRQWREPPHVVLKHTHADTTQTQTHRTRTQDTKKKTNKTSYFGAPLS